MFQKELYCFYVALAHRFVQRGVPEFPRRVNVCASISQRSNLLHLSANRSDMKRTFAEIADLVHIYKLNLAERRKLLVFVAT